MPSSPDPGTLARIRTVARRRLGYERLRPGQEEAIAALLAGRDTLALMPTGWGKSAIYQIAGLLLPGPTVVVSPLLALQRDQVEAIASGGMGAAALVNSTLSAAERDEAFARLLRREAEFLLLAPEQFAAEETLARLRAARPSLFVVDEAHCVGEWGHDFRPDYLRLGAVIEALGHPVVLALTATAAPPVREEILTRLGMGGDARVVALGFDRPNVWLGARTFHDERDKLRALLEFVREAERPGIVYAATRRHTEEVAVALRGGGIAAAHYHAGMRDDERAQTEAAFMEDRIEVIVATSAFGMGVDKSNVRFVAHYDVSDSLDAYYQEIGRAGRDGEPARALLFYRPEDVGLWRFLTSGGKLEVTDVERVAEALEEADGPVDPRALAEETGLPTAKVERALNRLDEVGTVETLADGDVVQAVAERGEAVEQAAEEAVRAQERYRSFMRSRVRMMEHYAVTENCRREFLLSYFGERSTPPCGACDNCQAGLVRGAPPSDEPFPLNSRVRHRTLGDGTVMRYDDDAMVVLFDDAGYRTLAVSLVLEQGLVEAVG